MVADHLSTYPIHLRVCSIICKVIYPCNNTYTSPTTRTENSRRLSPVFMLKATVIFRLGPWIQRRQLISESLRFFSIVAPSAVAIRTSSRRDFQIPTPWTLKWSCEDIFSSICRRSLCFFHHIDQTYLSETTTRETPTQHVDTVITIRYLPLY
jgi:hypothetical protein